jgi:SAM-dependent methyltransferase
MTDGPQNFFLSSVLSAVQNRVARYRETKIFDQISEYDDMFCRNVSGAMDHYLSVGRSAIEIIAKAMIQVGRTDFKTVLDLPCGGGRVTRHLAAFLPESELCVGDLNRQKQEFVCRTLGAIPTPATADFKAPPQRDFDLIFVGSLLTHLNSQDGAAAIRWFIEAAALDGIIVLSTHGRRHDFAERQWLKTVPEKSWAAVTVDCMETGFGYVETERYGLRSYGMSWSAPSWLMRQLEKDPRIRIVSFCEAAWDDHHDIVVLQRRPLYSAA